MIDGLAGVHPGLVVLAAALIMPFLGRRSGHGLGILATGYATAWTLTVPLGTTVPMQFLGFEAVFVHLDDLSRVVALVFGVFGSAAVLYAAYSEASNRQTAFALSYVAASYGAVLAGDWLTMLFAWELMAITSTLLVWDYGGRAVRPGFRYALLHGLGGTFLMIGIVAHYDAVGSFLFTEAAGIEPGLPALLVALGIGVNVGFVGFHAWLPDTYPRPQVAASVFLCVYTTKTGVYGMARAFPDGHLWIAYMGGAMAVVGVTFALLQSDMRRLLSYHIQSQVGYMVAGVGVGTALAQAGAIAHVYNHILYKGLLFMVVGVVILRTGEENLEDLGGLWREMPVTALAFGIAALSISGFPGFNGFVSKGMVVAAAHKEHLTALYWLLLAAGVGTFMSFIKLGYYVFLHGESDVSVPDGNRGQQVAMLGVAGLCVLYGVYPDALFPLLPGTGASKAHPFTVSHILEGLALAAAGLVGFVLLKKPLSMVGRVPDVDALYNPAIFYGTRGLVVGVTELYAAVDRAVVQLGTAATWTAGHPREAVSNVPGAGTSIDRENHLALRASIGTSVSILVVVLTLALFLFVVF